MSTDQEKIKQLQAALAALDALPTEMQNPEQLNLLRMQIRDLVEQSTITQGAKAKAVGTQGILIDGDNAGTVVTGSNNNITINQIVKAGKEPIDEAEIINYLRWLADRTGTIELRGIKRDGQQIVQLPLDSVYVSLKASIIQSLRPISKGSERFRRSEGMKSSGVGGDFFTQKSEVSLNQLLSIGKRLIITGGPGSGKTTVLLHLAWAMARGLASNDADLVREKIGAERLMLPIFIPLPAYATYLRELPKGGKARQKTLATFIAHYLIERQSSLDIPETFFAQLLKAGRQVMLLLDGLDEVADEDERARVRAAIEDLAAGRDDLLMIVTCRTAAYTGRYALGRDFREVAVQPLDEEQRAQLVQQAYRAIFLHDQSLAVEKGTELLKGIQDLEAAREERLGDAVEPLVTSPLMVRMLLIVHFSERRLPDQRAELYMKAADNMLAPYYAPDEQITEQIGRLVGGSRELHRELVQTVAFHMHQQGTDQGREIEEQALRRFLVEETEYDAEVIEDFITATRLRGTLMEERLKTYRFIHLSFQEYLAARHIAFVTMAEGGLPGVIDFLTTRLTDSWWREPILLVVGVLAIESPKIAQQLLRSLVRYGERSPADIDGTWAAAELAAVAALEWPGLSGALKGELGRVMADLIEPPELEGEYRQDILAQKLPARLTSGNTLWRIRAGEALGRLGDPRQHVTTIEGMRFCYVPPGPFWMGLRPEDGNEAQEVDDYEMPQHQVDLPYGYWIAQLPLTYGQYAVFQAADGYADPRWWLEAIEAGVWHDGQVESVVGKDRSQPADIGQPNQPLRGVHWYEGLAFCRWLSADLQGRLPSAWQLSLPTEAEWEKGARGGLELPIQPIIRSLDRLSLEPSPTVDLVTNRDEKRPHPWGGRVTAQHANYQLNDSHPSDISGCTLFPLGISPYGGLEMAGNVWEWAISQFKEYPYVMDDGREELKRSVDERNTVLRGWSGRNSNIYGACGARYGYNPDGDDNYVGFRIVLVPVERSGL